MATGTMDASVETVVAISKKVEKGIFKCPRLGRNQGSEGGKLLLFRQVSLMIFLNHVLMVVG